MLIYADLKTLFVTRIESGQIGEGRGVPGGSVWGMGAREGLGSMDYMF